MGKKEENTAFICAVCHRSVLPFKHGTYRNHCPFCLTSVHLDVLPGDRKSTCKGIMKPIGVKNHSKKGWQIVHQCLKCRMEKVNVVGIDDDWSKIIELCHSLQT
jgi:hypothetical protein